MRVCKIDRMPAILPLKSNKLTLTTAKTSTRKLRIMELAPHISVRGQHGFKKSRPVSRILSSPFKEFGITIHLDL